MREAPPVAPDRRRDRISRRDLATSLAIGLCLGVVAGMPIGWFAHRLFAQQRAAQVLLCRQQHYGQAESDLQRTCGTVY